MPSQYGNAGTRSVTAKAVKTRDELLSKNLKGAKELEIAKKSDIASAEKEKTAAEKAAAEKEKPDAEKAAVAKEIAAAERAAADKEKTDAEKAYVAARKAVAALKEKAAADKEKTDAEKAYVAARKAAAALKEKAAVAKEIAAADKAAVAKEIAAADKAAGERLVAAAQKAAAEKAAAEKKAAEKEAADESGSYTALVKFSEVQVGEWLDLIKLSEHKPAFAESSIDGSLLCGLDDTDLSDLGVSNRFHRRKILAKIKATVEEDAEAEAKAAQGKSAAASDLLVVDSGYSSPVGLPTKPTLVVDYGYAQLKDDDEQKQKQKQKQKAASEPDEDQLRVISSAKLSKMKLLGEGISGQVFRACYCNETVCVKKPKRSEMTASEWAELQLNVRLKPHPNVLGYIGVVMEPRNLMHVLPYISGGALDSVLQQDPQSEAAKQLMSAKGVVAAALDMARGLAHLHAAGIVHRDVAARNCLVDTEHDCRLVLCDFGLARQTSKEDDSVYSMQSNDRVPMPWMAPECFKREFSPASDVWAWAVTVWEVLTGCAERPFAGMPNESIGMEVALGARLAIPEHTPGKLAQLMASCWAVKAADRPTAEAVVAELHAM